jgi:Domain of unknown function (DUF5655)
VERAAGRKAALRPIDDKLIEVVSEFGDDVRQVPKKGYVSLRRARQFAMIQPSATDRIDVGLVLQGTEPALLTTSLADGDAMAARAALGDLQPY